MESIKKIPGPERTDPGVSGKLAAMDFPIHGHVAPGFESVRAVFEENFVTDIEVGASFCVLLQGNTVVDLWGGFRDRDCEQPWTSDTLVNVFSTTKGPAATAVASVVETGALDYGAAVADYWPQLRAARRGLTVAQLLSHQAGICGLRAQLDVSDLYDWDGMCARLETEEPFWEPGSAMGYHAIVWGFLVGELVRRATGHTLAEILHERITAPLNADFHLGVADDDLHRIAPLIAAGYARHQALTPSAPAGPSPMNTIALENPIVRTYHDVYSQSWQQAEIAASNGHANASGIARIYGALAHGGELDGVRVLRPESVAALRVQEWGMEPDLVLGRSIRRGRGVILNTVVDGKAMFGPNPSAFGHSGTGGSMGFADPVAGLGIGYAMNQLHAGVLGRSRSERLVAAVYKCPGLAQTVG